MLVKAAREGFPVLVGNDKGPVVPLVCIAAGIGLEEVGDMCLFRICQLKGNVPCTVTPLHGQRGFGWIERVPEGQLKHIGFRREYRLCTGCVGDGHGVTQAGLSRCLGDGRSRQV